MLGKTRLGEEALGLFENAFGPGNRPCFVYAPGRLNLIGEHIDYHNLAVLPIAIERGICIAFRRRPDQTISAVTDFPGASRIQFSFAEVHLEPGQPGDWSNYLKAAALAVRDRFGLQCGMDAAVASDLPPAAGLSSSSALLIASTLALLAANDTRPSLPDLMEVLPDGEQFVGTRGGGMDHAAILAARRGHAVHIRFNPFSYLPVAVPDDWRFLVANSRQAAEKSAAVKEEYNSRRAAGTQALAALGFVSYREALQNDPPSFPKRLVEQELRDAFDHVTSEAVRVENAVVALRQADLEGFGQLLSNSHASLRDRLRVSTDANDALVNTAVAAGAAGARITGAGFGGCILAVCRTEQVEKIRDTLRQRHYQGLADKAVERHLFVAEPAAGALEILHG